MNDEPQKDSFTCAPPVSGPGMTEAAGQRTHAAVESQSQPQKKQPCSDLQDASAVHTHTHTDTHVHTHTQKYTQAHEHINIHGKTYTHDHTRTYMLCKDF